MCPVHADSSNLVVQNELSELSRVSGWIDTWAQQHRIPATLAQVLDLCAMEVVTNVISYAYEDGAAHPISVTLSVQEDLVSLEVEDEGKPFNPLERPEQAPPKSLEEARIGGWGLRIVRHFSDELRYCRAAARNRLTVVFRHPGWTSG